MGIGSYIKEMRRFMKMTQQELAEKACISPQQLSQYERGVRTPKSETVGKIAKAMGFSMMEFMQMYHLSAASMPPDDRQMAMAFVGTSTESLEDDLLALKRLMNASGYNLTCVNGEYYLTGKHGGYALSDAQVNMLLDGTLKNIGAMCEMMESTLSQQGHSFAEATKTSSEGKDTPEE